MPPERWTQLKDLFERAMELDPPEWERFAEQACAGDDELQHDLLRLLEDNAEAKFFWSNPPFPNLQVCTWNPGTVVLGRFRLVRFVGRGGMGEVYEARDLVLNQKVALKTIRPEAASDPRVLSRFKQEINLGRKVTDPHVSRIHEIFTCPIPFLTMEFLEGETLSRKIHREGPLSEIEARSIALQLCQALEAAHTAGVIHRDFKSGNVMVRRSSDGTPWAVVTDFGVATMTALVEDATTLPGPLTRPGAIIGTPAYMAPEQLLAEAATARTDLYALGIVMYEMLAGRTPFTSVSLAAAAMERLKNRPAPPSSIVPGLSTEWDRVIAQCLEYEKERRPKSAVVVAAMLRGERQVDRRHPRWWETSRHAAVLFIGLLLLVGGFMGWIRWGNRYHRPSHDAQARYDDGTVALHEGTYLKAAQALERAVQLDQYFVLAHARLADAYTELDYTDKAKDEMLLATSMEGRKDLPDVDKDYVEAVQSTMVRNFPAAVKSYQRILSVLPESGKSFGLVDLGRTYEAAGQFQAAVEAYATAAQKAPEYPACFLHLGILYSRLERQAEADTAFRRAATLYKASSNLEGQAEVEFQQGLAATQQERLDVARAHTETALTAARVILSTPLEVRALLQLSSIDYLSGDMERASQDANQAINLARDNGIGYFWSTQGLLQLGVKCLKARDYGNAELYLQKALSLARKNHSERLEAMALVNLASVRDRQGRYDEVIPLARAAMNYYQEHGFVTNANHSITLLARAQRERGDLEGALVAFSAQGELGEKAHDPVIASTAFEGIGGVYERLEKFPEALAYYQLALELGKERGPGFLGYQSLHCAGVLASLGRYQESKEKLARAESGVKAEPALIPEIAIVKAEISLSQGRNKEALDLCQKTLDTNQQLAPAMTVALDYLGGLGEIRLGITDDGVRRCQNALTRAREHSIQSELPGASLALIEALLAKKDLKEALALAQDAVLRCHKSGLQDSEWRAQLLLAQICQLVPEREESQKAAGKALDILKEFNHNWNSLDARSYRERRDVKAARTALTKLINAKNEVSEWTRERNQ